MTIRFALLFLISSLAGAPALAQFDEDTYYPVVRDDDHSELPSPGFESIRADAADDYQYSYDSLLVDIAKWVQNPNVTLSNIGQSVQGRTLWQLSITSPANLIVPRKVVAIHVRTHPNEQTVTYVINAMIEQLLSNDPRMRRMLEQTVFNIIPMYNPDGVELRLGRVNANGIDLEREWDKPSPAIEAAQLKARYAAFMSSPTPIDIMLNFHSDSRCDRFFVYHVAEATSENYAQKERRFIDGVVRYYRAGIQPWSFNQTWQGGPPTHFPESWFWFNFGESVLALTYEDMHCELAGAYDTTAYALLGGLADYLDLDLSGIRDDHTTTHLQLLRNAVPNPFSSTTVVRYALPSSMHVSMRIVDALGAQVALLVDEAQDPGWHEVRWDASAASEGMYYCVLHAGMTTNTLPVIKIR